MLHAAPLMMFMSANPVKAGAAGGPAGRSFGPAATTRTVTEGRTPSGVAMRRGILCKPRLFRGPSIESSCGTNCICTTAQQKLHLCLDAQFATFKTEKNWHRRMCDATQGQTQSNWKACLDMQSSDDATWCWASAAREMHPAVTDCRSTTVCSLPASSQFALVQRRFSSCIPTVHLRRHPPGFMTTLICGSVMANKAKPRCCRVGRNCKDINQTKQGVTTDQRNPLVVNFKS